MAHPQLAIVIVNYKVKHFVAQCLDAVAAAIKTIDTEVWVIDNASNDGSVAFLREEFPWCNIIANEKNVGFARANNQVLRATKAEYVLLLNPDTLIGESTLAECIRFMRVRPEAGAVGIRMMNAQGNFLPESKRGMVTPFVAFCKIAKLGKLFPKSRLFNRYYLGHLPNDKVCEAPILSGAFMFIRRTALEQAGYLDERYFMYGEDIDLSYSILKAGFRNYYLPIPMLHYKGESESAAANQERYFNAFYGAMELFYDKYHQGSTFLRSLIKLSIAFRKRIDKRSVKKETHSIRIPKPLDLSPSSPLATVASGDSVEVDRTQCSYDYLLSLMKSAEGKRITFFIRDPHRGITLGPGGILRE